LLPGAAPIYGDGTGFAGPYGPFYEYGDLGPFDPPIVLRGRSHHDFGHDGWRRGTFGHDRRLWGNGVYRGGRR
jgi:hypothetical protein